MDKHARKAAHKKLSTLALTIFVIVTASLGLTAVTGLQTWHARQDQLREAEADMTNLVYSLTQHAEDMFEDADTSLMGLIERLEAHGASPKEIEKLQPLLDSYLQHLQQIQTITIFNEQGQPLAATNPFSMKAAVTDRAYFKFHQSNPSRDAYIGPAIRSRSFGTWVIPISRRYNHNDGRFAGVVLASIKMSHLQKFYDSFAIDKAGTLGLALKDGTILVRRPYQESVIGTNLAKEVVFGEYLPKPPSSMVEMISPNDGVERLYGYNHAKTYPLVVFIAVSKRAILSSWQANANRYITITCVVIAVLASLGSLLYRQIQLGLKTESQLRITQKALETACTNLEQLANQDSLTGLGNRRKLEAVLQEEFSRATRTSRPLAFILIDIDYFKRYNDTYGHVAGDTCLEAIGQAVRHSLHRPSDAAMRYGGEELAVVLPDTDEQGALVMAQKIQKAIEALHIPHSSSPNGIVTVSVGLHGFIPQQAHHNLEDLIISADKALYSAKSKGRNQVSTFNELL